VRYLSLGVVALFALLSVSARADEWSHNYPVTGKPDVVVDANDGEVEVSVASSQQVEVRVTTRGWKINDDVQVTGNQSGNRVEVKLHKTARVCFGFCFQSIKVEVHVPRESDVNIHTGDGNVRVDRVRGNLQLETNDGDVRVHDVEGSLHADTHDGNLDVNGRFDLLNLHTGDGNIDAEVSASSAPQQPGWMLRTGDGNVRMRLPDRLGADLDAHSGDGHVRVDFPITTSTAGQENAVRGKINGGGIPIELRTGDGDIHVEKM
jgi:DUF4097 and DUF4098 domain-containing protein YvlB